MLVLIRVKNSIICLIKERITIPYYLYQNPKTKEIVEIFQHMNDIHEYEENEVKFKRVFTKPNASFDSLPIDPHSAKDFARITNKPGKIGDLWDRAEEMSQKRADKEGIDPVKQKFYKEYSKKHKGVEHPEEKREYFKNKRKAGKKKLSDSGINVSWE